MSYPLSPPVRFFDTLSWNLSLSDDSRLVTRNQTDGGGGSIVYLAEELEENETCSFTVEAVDPAEREGLEALSLKIGLTTCDSSIVTNFPFHVIEVCNPSHDCEGHSITIKVKSANLVGDEVRMERKPGGELKVFVNDACEFAVSDPHDSFFPFSRVAYPFVVLCGSVGKLRVTGIDLVPILDQVRKTRASSVPEVPTNTSMNRQRQDFCCVICMDKVVSHMAVPCNHAAFCDFDANEHMKNSKQCPVCRKKVTNFVRIFIP